MSFFKKAQQQVAHTSKVPVLGNQDLRTLQDIISTEKDFIKTNTKSATEFKRSAESLKAWAAEEGEDLHDVLGKLSVLFDHYTTSQNRFNSHLSTERLHFKSIRTREESLANLKSRKRSLGSTMEKVERKLAKMGSENKELMRTTQQLKEMRAEMESLRVDVMEEETTIGDFKRRTSKEAMGLKCAGLLELAEKLTIVAEIGKLMLKEIPLQSTRPGMPRVEYLGFAKTESLLQEATRCIADVGFTPTGPSSGIPRFDAPTNVNSAPCIAADGAADEQYYYGGSQRGNDDHGKARTHDPRYSTYDQESGNDAGFSNQANSSRFIEDLSCTPIYATHASSVKQGWDHDKQGSTFNTEGLNDPAADEWGHNNAAAAAIDGNTERDYYGTYAQKGQNGETDGGFMMQNSASAQPSNASPPHSLTQHNVERDPYGGIRQSSMEPTVPEQRQEGHSAADGYGDPNATNLGAPTLPPLRTSSPFPENAPAPPVPADEASYFHTVGATRAHQEAQRRPTSPGAPSPSSRMSSYSAFPAIAGSSGSTPEGGKKVTAAAFRRGFNRVPSSQPVDDGATTPVPPGGYVTPESELAPSSTQPLSIQKRNSAIGAAAAAGTPSEFQGRRYSVENLDGNDAPAPPYRGNDAHFGNSAALPTLPAQYGAPPPPGY